MRRSASGIQSSAKQAGDSAIGDATQQDCDNCCSTQHQQYDRPTRFWLPYIQGKSRCENHQQPDRYRRNVRRDANRPSCLGWVHPPHNTPCPVAPLKEQVCTYVTGIMCDRSGAHMYRYVRGGGVASRGAGAPFRI
jgi:hypothetical protein